MNNQTTLIIGAAGNNGVATIESLVKKQDAKNTIRAAVRSADKAAELKIKFPSIETVIIDLDKPETLIAAYKGVTKNIQEVGKELGVDAILEGNADLAASLLQSHVTVQEGTFNDFVASLPADLTREHA